MKKLIDVPNIATPNSNFPKGYVVNKSTGVLGTKLGSVLFADLIQFFQKLIIDASITENDLADGVTNGYQLIEALENKILAIQPLNTKIIEIGDWDMDATDSLPVAHGIIDFKTIRSISIIIRNDTDNQYYPLNYVDDTGSLFGGSYSINTTNILMHRVISGIFDTTSFNSTTYNRGFITIEYID